MDHSLKTVKKIVCVLPNKVLSYKLQKAAYLSQIERKLVLTGANLLDLSSVESMYLTAATLRLLFFPKARQSQEEEAEVEEEEEGENESPQTSKGKKRGGRTLR